MNDRRRLYVVGDPIAHSRSPLLHRAAYRFLGLPWSYEARRVVRGDLGDFIAENWGGLHGMSITMPLKPEALEIADGLSDTARATGVVNTLVVLEESARLSLWGHNTDVGGIVDTMRSLPHAECVTIVGSGSTAASAALAAVDCGASRIRVVARNEERREGLAARIRSLGVVAETDDISSPADAGAVISTIPAAGAGAVQLHPSPGGWLLEASYAQGRSAFGRRWDAAGGRTVDGLEMLLHQAVRQVLVFRDGPAADEAPPDPHLVEVMREALRSA